MRQYEDSISSAVNGLPIYQAQISVQNGDGSSADIFSDNGVTPLAQPILTNGLGFFSFFIADGVYTLIVADPGGDNPRPFPNIEIFEDARNVSTPVGEPRIVLPSVGARSGQALGFDSSGNPIAIPTDTFDITNEMQALFDGTTANAEATAADVATATTQAAIAVDAAANILANNTIHVRKSSPTSRASTTTLAADPDLVITLPANTARQIRGTINYSAGATGDIKYRITGPASPTSIQINRRAVAPGDTAYSAIGVDTAYSGSDIVVAGGAGSGTIELDITVYNGANAGTLAFEWAQNASDATPTITKAGSELEYIALPLAADFAFANTAIAKLGSFTAGTGSGHNLYQCQPFAPINSRIETAVVGTRCEAQVFNVGSTPNYVVTVDGGTPFTVVAPSTGWSFITLFTGLADALHTVGISGTYFDADIALRVTGTQPSLAYPTTLPATYVLGSAPFSTYGALEGLTTTNTSIYPSPYQRTWESGSGWGMRFKATTTSVRLWHYNASSPSPGRMVLLQDGVQIADVTPTRLGTGYEILTLATGLSGSHEYEIKFVAAGRGGFVWQLLVDSLDTVAHTAKALDVAFGDSIAAEVGSPGGIDFDSRLGDAYLIATAGSKASVLRGISGAKVSTALRDAPATLIGGMPVLPTRIFVTAGTNDMPAATPLVTFQADYQTMLANLRTAAPSAKIYARGILDRIGYTSGAGATTRNGYNAAISAAVTAIADANIVYTNTDGWINPSLDTADGLHPTSQGYAKIAAAQLLVL